MGDDCLLALGESCDALVRNYLDGERWGWGKALKESKRKRKQAGQW